MNEYKQSLNQIQLADERGQTAVVVELCRKHLRKFPNDGIAWVYYGIAQLICCHYATAEKSFRRAFDLYPQKSLHIVYSHMGHLFKNRGDFKQAAVWYRKAVKHKPHDATYHVFLADNAFKFGFFEQAKKFSRCLKMFSGGSG
jgi:tetratricopeptide (TPR) repeat protein